MLALVFDFDGVILDSLPLKRRAFTSIFADHPAALEQISSYNARQAGLPRVEKIRFVCEHILQLQNLDRAVEMYLSCYAEALQLIADNAPLTSGIRTFLEQINLPKFICSSAPKAEVMAQVLRHQLDHHFGRVYGFPSRKVEVLRELKQEFSRLIFFGDAPTDYDAAQEAEVGFIGVVHSPEEDRFRGRKLLKIPGFDNVIEIQSLMRSVILEQTDDRTSSNLVL